VLAGSEGQVNVACVIYPFVTPQEGVSQVLNVEYKIKLHKYGGFLRQMGLILVFVVFLGNIRG
jgi:hypothetical protein